MRSLDPNPPLDYPKVRGYTNTTTGVQQSGPWERVSSDKGPIKLLEFVSVTAEFQDLPQVSWCKHLVLTT